jgi:hypothetical protein
MQSSCLPLLSQTPNLRRSRWCGKVSSEEITPENVIVPQAKSSEDPLPNIRSPEEILDEVYDGSPLPEADTDTESDPTDEEKWGLLYKITVLLVFILYTLIMYRMAAGPEL